MIFKKWYCGRTTDRQTIIKKQYYDETTDRQEATGIETLKEILKSLKITEEYTSDANRAIELASEDMSTAPVPVAHDKTVQVVIPKSIVPDLE